MRNSEQADQRFRGRLPGEHVFLEEVIDQLPLGVIVADAASRRIVVSNLAVEKVLGRPVHDEDLIEASAGFVLLRSDGSPCQPDELPLHRSLQGITVTGLELEVCRADGTRLPVRVNARPILKGNRVVAAVATLHDMGERDRAELALRQSEERYHALFQASPYPMLIFDWANKGFIAVNDAAVQQYGWSQEQFLTMTIWDIHPPADRPRLLQHFDRPPPVGKVGLWRHWKKDGTVFDVEIRGHYIEIGGRTARFVLALDVSDRVLAEERLRSSEAKYRSLLENLDVQIFLKDRTGRYVAANERYCQALGATEANLIGRTDFDFFPPAIATRHQADDLRVLLHGERVESEEQMPLSGKEVTARIVRTPVKDEHGQVASVLGMVSDVTEQRALEGQVRQAQKMEAIGMLAGGVAHDFNNLLTVIAGNIALAMGSLPENHVSRDLLQTAERAGIQANELTNRLLSFARQTILRPVPTPLQTCIEETVRILRRTLDPRITIETQTPADLWPIEADPAQINQVLLNLCLNARDAMPQGGLLRLTAANMVIDPDYARQHVESHPGEYVRLSISDTGHGIPAEIRARVFEPFFTTKPPGKGTGLGLSMVFGIVKQHQGWIEFESEVNQGTRFDIYLPRFVSPSQATAAVKVVAPDMPRGGEETILLADDEPMIRRLGRTILERYGYHVLLADDGLEAVQLYEREKQRIALVILDLTMPRLSGHDALQHLLQIEPAVKVLLASGYSAEHLDQSYHEHAMGFLSKPFRPDQLARVVREVLDRPVSK